MRVDRPALPQHSVYELAQPAAIARIEVRGASVERTVEHLTVAKVGAYTGGDHSRRCHASYRNLESAVLRTHSSIPVTGDEGTAVSRRGMRPAR